MNPGVFVNIQQVNVQQPREVNFGVGEQRFKNEENEENPKNGKGSLNGSRPNDKFLESFYNRSVLLPSVLQKIFSLRSIIRKRERNANGEKSGNHRDRVDSAAAVACGVSRPCLTHDNQTGDGSKQLDIEIPTENDINISSDRNADIETSSDSNHDMITSRDPDDKTDIGTPSHMDVDIGTTSDRNIDLDGPEYSYSNNSVDIDIVDAQYLGSRNANFTVVIILKESAPIKKSYLRELSLVAYKNH